ncbi:cyclic GMP-binding protein C-like isoform X2 [Dysidea avara]
MMELAYQLALRQGTAFPRDLAVLLIGTENTGKTSLISTFLGEQFVEKRPATDGAETQICKVYAKGWKRITLSDKNSHLYGQFIHEIRKNANEMLESKLQPTLGAPLKPKPTNSSNSLFSESSDASPSAISSATAIPSTNSGTPKVALPTLNTQDLEAVSSHAVQYDLDSINVVAWDYAGQVIFHNTHSVFMSENGVPIITFNASMKLDDEIKPREGSPLPPECHTNISSLHYWLHTITSMRPVVDPPQGPMALLAGTHIDLLHCDIKEARKLAQEKILPQLERELRNKPYLKQLIGKENGIMAYLEKYCFFVSNKIPDEEIERLKSTVVSVAPSLKKKEPVVYLKIEQNLLLHKVQVISRLDLLDIAINCGFPVSEHSMEFEGLLSYLHNKRVILYFSKIPSLRNLVILSPHWLAKLFSYVITAHTYATGGIHDKAWERLTNYGILGGNLFGHMVQKFLSDYPSAVRITKDQVLAILLCFHLVARVTATTWFTEERVPPPDNFGDTFIVPSFVHHDDGRNPPHTKQEKIIFYRFEGGFVPTNLLNQLIVECVRRNETVGSRLLWMRHSKVGLRLGASQKYYVSRYEDGQTQGVQLTITTVGDDVNSLQERWGLIQFVDQQLNKIMEVFMPAEKKPFKYIPCSHCTIIHILFDMIGTPICCPFKEDKEVPANYYTDLLPADKSNYYGDCFTALDKIREQYDVMANSPVNKLLPSLYAKRVITLDDKKIMEAKPLQKDRMMYLLDDVLIRSLNIGYGSKYNGFLKVLEESDDDVLDDLTRTLAPPVLIINKDNKSK